VGKPEHRSAELVGLCIDMMGNAMLDSPEFMGEEALDFLCTIQDSDVWNEKYTLGDWNAVKWTDSERTFETIDNAGVSDVLRYTADTVIRCPDQCLKAAFAVTGMVWQIDGKRYWQNVYRNIWTIHSAGAYEAMDSVVREYLRKYDIELPAGEYISQIHDQYTDIIQSSFLQYIFCYVGLLNLILLLVLFSRQEDIGQAFLFTLPVILYSYGTMFLLATYDCRFFYYTYACFFTIMFLLLGKEKTDMLVILDSEC
jgi:hypothetical protein